MDKMDRDEKLWGGILGIIAILAALAEMFFNGFNAASVMGAVKDISGTLITVVLLVAFIKSLPRKPKDLPAILEQAVEEWGEDNCPLIFKTENYVPAQNSTYTQGFVLLQNPREYVSLVNKKLDRDNPERKKYAQYGNGKHTGKFLDFPSYEAMTLDGFSVLIVMEQSHFKNMPEINSIVESIVLAIGSRGEGKISAKRVGSSNKIRLECSKIESVQDVESFVDTLDFVLSLVKVVA